ncbi:MAG: hypothetical protein COB40_03805 [Marinosulfonomonas sp.]|nr:MAG: hypothetical protein COB40_03805 [Marinosulfonomonas sp.]
MVKPNKEFDEMIDPVELKEPKTGGKSFDPPEGIWMRGLMMLILAFMFGLAQTILGVLAVVQFLWMLFRGEKNTLLVEFGIDLGEWLAAVARFQSGATEDKPFPWAGWSNN